MINMGFTHEGNLLLLALALPAVSVLWYATFHLHQRMRKQYAEPSLLARYSRTPHMVAQLPSLAVWLTATACLVIASAMPVIASAPHKVQAGSLDVVVAFDVSQSMGAEDYKNTIPDEYRTAFFGAHGSRLDEAKYVVASQIMPAIENNRLGFVTYKGDGFAQADLTDDFSALRFVLDNWVTIGNAPGGGSDYARGMQEAIDAFHRDGSKNTAKVIVLFSDGGFTGDEQMLAKVEQELKDEHIHLVVLGLGLAEPVPIPQYDADGKFSGYVEVNGKKATTEIDEGPLRALISATGGKYVRLTPHVDLGINWPTALASSDKTVSQTTDIYQLFLAAVLALIFLLGMKGSAGYMGQWRAAAREKSSATAPREVDGGTSKRKLLSLHRRPQPPHSGAMPESEREPQTTSASEVRGGAERTIGLARRLRRKRPEG